MSVRGLSLLVRCFTGGHVDRTSILKLGLTQWLDDLRGQCRLESYLLSHCVAFLPDLSRLLPEQTWRAATLNMSNRPFFLQTFSIAASAPFPRGRGMHDYRSSENLGRL
jgi:hypothetical protein